MTTTPETNFLEQLGDYRYGFRDPDVTVFKTKKAWIAKL